MLGKNNTEQAAHVAFAIICDNGFVKKQISEKVMAPPTPTATLAKRDIYNGLSNAGFVQRGG